METKNYFLAGGTEYASNRPSYPDALANELARRCAFTEHALDVGCGSGQLASVLAQKFSHVTATDSSNAQLVSAVKHRAVCYRREPAERIGLPADSVDLVTAAQAAHWFNLEAFYSEVRRVSRPDAILALISYGVPTKRGAIGQRLNHFYWDEIHAFWPAERRHVEEGYKSLEFPFDEQALAPMAINCDWTLDRLIAYIGTWSATKRAALAGHSRLLEELVRDLGRLWPALTTTLTVTWPIVGRVARLS